MVKWVGETKGMEKRSRCYEREMEGAGGGILVAVL